MTDERQAGPPDLREALDELRTAAQDYQAKNARWVRVGGSDNLRARDAAYTVLTIIANADIDSLASPAALLAQVPAQDPDPMLGWRLAKCPHCGEELSVPAPEERLREDQQWKREAAERRRAPAPVQHDDWCDGSGSSAGSACCRAAQVPAQTRDRHPKETCPYPDAHRSTDPTLHGWPAQVPAHRGVIRVRTPDDQAPRWTARGDLVPGVPYSYISGDVAVVVDWLAVAQVPAQDPDPMLGWRLAMCPHCGEELSVPAPEERLREDQQWKREAAERRRAPAPVQHDDWCDGSGSSAGSACCRAAQAPAQEERHRASLTLSPNFGPALWLDRRFVARLGASVEDSRITPEEPEPRWYRDALVFVDAVNSAHGQRPPLNLARLSRLWDVDEADIRAALVPDQEERLRDAITVYLAIDDMMPHDKPDAMPPVEWDIAVAGWQAARSRLDAVLTLLSSKEKPDE